MKRDMVGYGNQLPPIKWPNHAKVVLNFVLNYEEGAENSPVNGDDYAERYGAEFPLAEKPIGERSLSMESLFEYGSRTGFWRLVDLFDQHQIPLTVFATGYALTLNDEICQYLKKSQHEVAGHGWRWIDYATFPEEIEREHIKKTIETIKRLTGYSIKGWYTGRKSMNTRKLLIETSQFIYDSDSYADDYPYFEKKHLIIPYTLDCNDFRYTTQPGFNHADEFLHYLIHTFDYLYQEHHAAMMTIGLHSRISGHPGRAMAIKQFIEYIKAIPNVWISKRIDIAQYWINNVGS